MSVPPVRATLRRLVVVLAALVCGLAALPGLAVAQDYADTTHSEINYSPAASGSFIGSPSIVVLPNGDYLATQADFGPGSSNQTTQVFRSRNAGVAWEPVAGSPVDRMCWATVFEQGGTVYLMGAASCGYGDAVIAASTDNGETWTEAVPLLRGAYHTGDTPVLVQGGRIYKTYEQNLRPPNWSPFFRPLMISAPIGADLLDPASWTRTNNVERGSVLEGNPVVGPDGMIWNVMRWNDSRTQAWVTKLDPANPSVLVDAGPVNFPYGVAFSKFFLQWDASSERYLLVGNAETSSTGLITQRNYLNLYESTDLQNWRLVRNLVEDDVESNWATSVAQSAFSQPTAIISGDDLLVVSRTAYDGAANYHNANRFTFHRYDDFRAQLGADDELAYYSFDDPERPAADVSRAADTDADLSAEGMVVPGRVGQGIAISGPDTYLDLGNRIHPLLDGRGQVSVTMWVRPDPSPGQGMATLFGSRINGGAAGLDLLYDGRTVQLGGRSVGSDPYQSRTFPMAANGQWRHLAAVWDFAADDLRLFVDGRQVTGQGAVAFTSPTYEVGSPGQPDRAGVAPNGTAPYAGVIDELRIFGTGLTSDDARSMVRGIGPTLESLTVDGVPVPGFNPDVRNYDVTVAEPVAEARIVADAGRGSRVESGRRTIAVTDRPSERVEFLVRHGRETATYSLTVRYESPDTDLAGLALASGSRRSFAPGDTDLSVEVSEVPGVPLDLTITDAIAMRTADGATAEVIEQPDPADRDPVGVVRVTAEDGSTADHQIRVIVERQLVSASADPTEGDAPLEVTLRAEPTQWVEGAASYSWDFGDGTTGTGQEVSHTYTGAGSFVATVTLTDAAGSQDTAEVTIRARSAGGLIGNWPLDEGSGAAILDAGPYANNGTLEGGTREPGRDGSGGAVRFAGSGGIVLDDRLGVDANGATGITMSSWVRVDALPAPGQIGNWVFGSRISGGGAGFELYMIGDTFRVGARSQIADPYVRSDFRYSAVGEWHLITAVIDFATDQIGLYVDGMAQQSISAAGAFGADAYQYLTASQPDSIGRNPDGQYRMRGALDGVRVYDRALTAQEVTALATMGG